MAALTLCDAWLGAPHHKQGCEADFGDDNAPESEQRSPHVHRHPAKRICAGPAMQDTLCKPNAQTCGINGVASCMTDGSMRCHVEVGCMLQLTTKGKHLCASTSVSESSVSTSTSEASSKAQLKLVHENIRANVRGPSLLPGTGG